MQLHCNLVTEDSVHTHRLYVNTLNYVFGLFFFVPQVSQRRIKKEISETGSQEGLNSKMKRRQ